MNHQQQIYENKKQIEFEGLLKFGNFIVIFNREKTILQLKWLNIFMKNSKKFDRSSY